MTEQPFDEAYKTIKDAIGAVQAVQHLAAEADTLRAEVARLREALCFYAEKAFWHDGGIDFSSYENCADLVLSTIEADNGEAARAVLAHGEADTLRAALVAALAVYDAAELRDGEPPEATQAINSARAALAHREMGN
jgi:cation transport regulator ChaB